ncbi:MAG TPA: carboxypeptidase regulatory-like domain-containing protein, partial [bacterium]
MKGFHASKFAVLFILFTSIGYGQNMSAEGTSSTEKYTVAGRILDASNGKPLEYAMVILASKNDARLSTGSVTAADGTFLLKNLFPGPYRVTVQFMGYKTEVLDDVKPARNSDAVDIGIVRLQPTVLQGEGVKVEADRPEFEYKIDRRVINVGQQQTALSGTAVDVI